MWNAFGDVTFGTFFLNSLKLATLNTVGQLIACSMAAFAFAVIAVPRPAALFGLLLATLIIPFQVVLVPNFILWRKLPHPFERERQLHRHPGAAVGRGVPRRGIRDLPAAPVLPDDPARARRRRPGRRRQPVADLPHIYLPLSKPALATLAIFTFMWTWNDLIDPLIYLRHLDQYTTTVGLAFFQGQFVGKWPEMMAGALVSLLPMIILFVVAQQYFVRGIAMTGLKG